MSNPRTSQDKDMSLAPGSAAALVNSTAAPSGSTSNTDTADFLSASVSAPVVVVNSATPVNANTASASESTTHLRPTVIVSSWTGLIVVELMGRLGNNFFQMGFARILAQRLLGKWEVVLLPNKESAFIMGDKTTKCFPHALPDVPRVWLTNYHNIINNQTINYLNVTGGQQAEQALWMEQFYGVRRRVSPFRPSLRSWMAREKPNAWFCGERICDFTEPALSAKVHDLLLSAAAANATNETAANETSTTTTHDETHIPPTTRLIYLSTYFIHYDWIQNYEQELREIFTIDDQNCCPTQVPADAVVWHFRNSEDDTFQHNLTPQMVLSIMEQYNYTHRPLWIVCEPRSRDTVQSVVDALTESNSTNASRMTALTVIVQFGIDGLDAMCMLMQATDLIVSEGSTFSAMGALLGNATRVHCPVHTLVFPPSILVNPKWHYHWVNETNGSIIELNVDPSRIQAIVW